MIRDRIFGSDTEFSNWLRRQSKELPSYSLWCGFVASDADLYIHRYLSRVDGIGTREIQGLMDIEVKGRRGEVGDSQQDTLFKRHLGYRTKPYLVKGQICRHFGVSFLFMTHATPDYPSRLEWGRFNAKGEIIRRDVTLEQFFKLLRFELHPDSFETNAFRRHHRTREVVQVKRSELGFEYEELVIKRS